MKMQLLKLILSTLDLPERSDATKASLSLLHLAKLKLEVRIISIVYVIYIFDQFLLQDR